MITLSLSTLRLFVGDLLLYADGVMVITGIEEGFERGHIDVDTFFCSNAVVMYRHYPAESPEYVINRSQVLAR